jgi:N-dimethylarginine dimethylaminohydrolase
MKFNIWNKWDPLKVCMLGNNYTPEFFNGVNPNVETPLKRICEETLEDLENYKEVLQQFGVKVIQPELDRSERFIDKPKFGMDDLPHYPRGPLQPRDYQLILGNKAYSWQVDHPSIAKCLKDYGGTDTILVPRHIRKDFKGSVYGGAKVFMIGKDVYLDNEYTKYKEMYNYIFKGWRKNTINVGDTHTDGCFHPIKPGAIISLSEIQMYENTFPGWDVCYLPDQSWSVLQPFAELKRKNKGKWWLAGEEDNDEFTEFVETWLTDWVGYVEETVFDVNVLVLDEHHVCVSNKNNEKVNTFLKKHKMEPVYVPWRHRYFWDGGLHCITLDLLREGNQQDYFPDRKKPVTDIGFI